MDARIINGAGKMKDENSENPEGLERCGFVGWRVEKAQRPRPAFTTPPL
jgi:hypothetical protein